jgi:hypothetical protein
MGVHGPHQFARAQLTAAGDSTVIAAPGAGRRIVVHQVYLSLHTVLNTSSIMFEDGAGGNSLFFDLLSAANNDLNGQYRFDGGPDGYPLTANTLLNMAVATANCTATCWVEYSIEILDAA